MLVSDDPTFIQMRGGDPTIAMILMAGIGGGKVAKKLAEGVYEIHHFGSSNWPPGYYDWMGIWELQEKYPNENPENDPEFNGVCDKWEQIVDKWPVLRESMDAVVITVTPIVKAEQPSSGGWRWHKWGTYIGEHEPTTEYIHDEPLIEKVYVYHVYLRKENIVERQIRIRALPPEVREALVPGSIIAGSRPAGESGS